MTNPGGLRTNLLFKGDTTSNPGNTDGVVTYEEVAGVLPFSNDTSIVSLTGAQFKEILEQQWQPAGSSRPFLALGLSDNVQTILDPAQPVGSRVTSVRSTARCLTPLRRTRSRRSRSSPLAVTTSPPSRRAPPSVTGLLDRDLFRQFFEAGTTVAPDFARQQVYATGLKESYRAGEKARINFTNLDMNALGAPVNTKLDLVKVNTDGSRKTVGSTTVTNGIADLAFTVRGGKGFEIVAQDSKTTIARAVVKTKPTLKAKVFPKGKALKSKKTRARMKIKIRSEVGIGPVTGRASVRSPAASTT